jgi:nicotinamide riboside kinase
MLVAFLGAPCSGKTTCAAQTFAALKRDNYNAEFISEYAREYIAEKKVVSKNPKVDLDDADQIQIMSQQLKKEIIFAESCKNESIVVVDGSALNSVLYMSEKAMYSDQVVQLIESAKANYDLIYMCSPFICDRVEDPNRIHNFEQSKEIAKKLERLIESNFREKKEMGSKVEVKVLIGNPHVRLNAVNLDIFTKQLEFYE